MADSDIGNITPNQMEIKLQDKVPVQLNYHSVPKPQYAELKANIENFYKKGWIINSSSSYSSPVASMTCYPCAVTIVTSTEKPSQIETLNLK